MGQLLFIDISGTENILKAMWLQLHKKHSILTIVAKKGRLQKILVCCFDNFLFLLEQPFPERN